MVVQHNLTAMNSNRMLGVTTSAQAKSSEKLSSGYRINRAADDAAGLTISEKMRKQIKGLHQASTNAQDGVSAVQTAEGALTEVHSMLQRMNELATQAANGTNSESERDAIQAEIGQLTTEIDRVAETTKFNEMYLLKGNPDGTSSDMTIKAHDAGLAGKLVDNGDGTSTFTVDKPLEDGSKVTIAGKEYKIGGTGGATGADGLVPMDELNADTDGYDTVANVEGATGLKAGDSISYDGKNYTLVDKIGLDDILSDVKAQTGDLAGAFKVGDITFTINAATGKENDKLNINDTAKIATIGKNKVEDYLKEALAEGKQVTILKSKLKADQSKADGTAASAALANDTILVESLGKGEISVHAAGDLKAVTMANAASGSTAAATVAKFKAGDSVTKEGTTTVATAETPTSAKDAYDAIDALNVGDKVKIGEGLDLIEYEIVDEDDVVEEDHKLTKEMILAKIHDGDTVNDGTNTFTVIGDIGLPEKKAGAEETITAEEAYAKMAEELQKASNIGTDEDKAASVVHDGDGKFTITQGFVEVKDGLSFNLHVGADADMTNKIAVEIESMSAAGLGIRGIAVGGVDDAASTYAIDAIADAIQKVSVQRSALGAVQNRLEHTIANLDNVVENTTAAESRIRDTDMAEEMVEFSKNNILAQAGQSMLAQANQSTQGVLSLLQ